MCLGKGTFGEVFQGVVTAGPLFGTKVAVKVISVGEDRENVRARLSRLPVPDLEVRGLSPILLLMCVVCSGQNSSA